MICLRPDADEGTDDDTQPTCLSSGGFGKPSHQGQPVHHISRSVVPVLTSSVLLFIAWRNYAQNKLKESGRGYTTK